MKLWQWFGCWYAYAVGSRQGWFDAPAVPPWVFTVFVMLFLARWLADIHTQGKLHDEAKKIRETLQDQNAKVETVLKKIDEQKGRT